MESHMSIRILGSATVKGWFQPKGKGNKTERNGTRNFYMPGSNNYRGTVKAKNPARLV